VEALVRRYLWVLDFVVAAMCALLMARATASLIEGRITAATPPTRPAPRPYDSSFAPVVGKQMETILKRNVFCSTCPPILEQPKSAETEDHSKDQPVKTSLPLQLISIMYAEPPLGWQWSLATVRDTENKTQGPFSTGMKIREAKIVAIEPTRIYLDNAGKPEYLDLIDAPAAAPTPEPTAAAPAAPAQDPLMAEMDRGIKKTGEHTYELQRSTLDQVLGNMSLLSRSARIVPEIRDGRPAGFRLYSVRPEGPFAKIGLQNGDVIASINGLEMSSPEKALEVYSKLKSASHLSLGLERNGQKLTKDYSIR
jgi:general secretion pathway protein C